VGEVVGAGIVAMAYSAGLSKKFDSVYSGVMVGAAYFAGIVIAATASAGYINPAVALGSRAWSAAYVIGPLVGGLLGVNIYNYLFSGASDTVSAASAPARSGSSKGVTVPAFSRCF
jgi:glycerol uptake facilitator-like aquaporin